MTSSRSINQTGYKFFPFYIFTGFFFYIWLILNPELIRYQQDPVFLTTTSFFIGFTAYPGGISEYIALFIGQLYGINWLGALVMTFLLYATCILTKQLIKLLNKGIAQTFVYLIPAVFLVLFQSDYNFPVSFILGLILTLAFFIAYLKMKHTPARFISYIIFAILLYYLSGIWLFFFSVLIVLHSLLNEQVAKMYKLLLLLAVVGLQIVLPFVSCKYLFLIACNDAYFITPDNYLNTRFSYFMLILPLFYIILVLFPWFNNSGVRIMSEKNPGKEIGHKTQVYLLSAITIVLLIFVNINSDKRTLQIEHYAREEKWDKVIAEMNRQSVAPLPSVYNANRALANTNQLLDKMFTNLQQYGTSSIFIPEKFSFIIPFHKSNYYFEIGHINESQHWAHEALSIKGPTPEILKRLAITYMVKGENQAAISYLKTLENTLFCRKWARSYLKMLSRNPDLSGLLQWKKIRDNMPDKDFIFYSDHSPEELLVLLEKNPKNLMAFQYFVAYQLLLVEIHELPVYINHLVSLNYKTIPRHLEEALILYMINNNLTEKLNWGPYTISQETIGRFNDYSDILDSFYGNQDAAKKTLYDNYRDTYWFYIMYLGPGKHMSQN